MKPTPRADGTSRLNFTTALIGLLTGVIVLFGGWYELNSKKRNADLETRLSEVPATPQERPLPEAEVESPHTGFRDPALLIEPQPESSTTPRTEPAAPQSETQPLAAPPERAAAPAADPHVKVMYDYRFEMQRCDAGGPLVTCRITVTSLRGDRRLTIGGFAYLSTRDEGIRSVAYTADGTDHFASEASLGSRAEPNAVAGSLVGGLPMAATVVFGDVPAGTSAFAAVRVAFGSDRREFLVPFESVPIR